MSQARCGLSFTKVLRAQWHVGQITVFTRKKHVTFEEDAGAYDQKDAAGFIHLNALRLKLIATRNTRG